MSSPLITEEDILNATDGGLKIILDLYPDAYESQHKRNRMFKARDEDTASAKLNRLKSGVYLVVDFGSSGYADGSETKGLNAVKLYMKENHVDWPRAIQELAQKYDVKTAVVSLPKAKYEGRPAKAEEEEDSWEFGVRSSWKDYEIEYLVPKMLLRQFGWYDKAKKKEAYNKIVAKLKYYNYHPLDWYENVKNRKVHRWVAVDNYPMYLIDEGTHQKLHQPKHEKKNLRFMYRTGTKPEGFIHGLKQLEKEFNKRKEDDLDEQNNAAENEDRGQESTSSSSDPRLDSAMLCAGGSDAIAAALMGYQVLWLNSESAKLENWDYIKISKMVKKIYQCMDIDATGLQEAHDRALQYLDIYTVELSREILRHRDSRGYQRKDLRDYLDLYKPYDFKQLVDNALPYRFWDERAKFDRKGNFLGMDYEFNNVHAYNFLQKCGFFRMAIGDKTDDFQYIHIKGNSVKETNPVRVRGFITHFLRERRSDVALRNAMFRTTQLSDTSLTNLDEIELDFRDYTPHSQFMFFRNKTIEVTGNGIIEHKSKTLDRFVWDNDIYDHNYRKIDAPFIITKNEAGDYDIEIRNKECLFLKYLVQTSRIHWRTELEERATTELNGKDRLQYLKDHQYSIDGPLLTAEEIAEQKSHLINKLFAMGYLMHRYKDRDKPWMVLGTDGKISLDGQSHGGSGKSLFLDLAMRALLKNSFMLKGRDPKMDADTHKFGGLTEYHRYIFIEDAHQYLNFDMFYTDVSGDIKVNPKGKTSYTIPFALAGKFSLSTNYALRNIGPSTDRRILYTVFSDYYHKKGPFGEYNEDRSPATEFGKQMFDGFDDKEWNDFYNTAAYALSFYLTTEDKLNPDMGNVNTRNLLRAIGDEVMEWASVYFAEESGNLNKLIVREEMHKDFMHHSPTSKLKQQGWKDRIEKYCVLHGLYFNPQELLNKQGKIIQRVDKKVYDKYTNTWSVIPGETITKEMFYISTTPKVDDPDAEGQPAPSPEDDDPF